MRHYKIHPIWTLLLLFFAVGCEKDTETVSLLAQLEQIEADADAKSYLQDESWIYWDTDDKFSVATDLMDNNTFKLSELEMRDGSYFNAVFNVEAPEGSQKFIALFPHNDNHQVAWQGGNLSSLQVNIPATQVFRTDDKGDFTFGKEAMPMVAWEPYGEVLHFHSLGGIVRIQLYATGNTNSDKSVTSIEFEEVNGKQISGLFDVKDWDQFAPYLESASTADADKKITLSCNRTIASGNNGFLTFYLVLPAYEPQRMSDNTTGTPYKLQMTVKASDNTQCVKTFSVMIRRNGLTMLRALEIVDWVSSGNGHANVHLVGNGTQERPFKIYTVDDLKKVRDAFNNDANQGNINGMLPDENTYFELMRNDLQLTPQTWTEGIRNFKGHFVFKANAASSAGHGITNTSGKPIFESNSGSIEGLVVKGSASFNYESFPGNVTSFYFSPICGTNNGTIKDCVIQSGSHISAAVLNSTDVESVGVTGFAVTNNGRIIGCNNQGSLSAPNRIVAGICLFNGTQGKIISCNIVSPSNIQASRIGGICYRNEGIVRTCYTAFNTASSQNATTANWGGIVYDNRAAVNNCALMPSGVINTTGTVGGIVNTNSGTIDSCRNNASQCFAKGVMGGIVAELNGGTIRNSSCDIPNSVFWFESTANANAVGGLVGMMTGGELLNSYCRVQIFANTGAVLGSVVGKVEGGTINHCYGWNNVSSPSQFYGMKSGSPSFSYAYNYNVASDGVTMFTCDGTKCYVGSGELSDLLNGNQPSGCFPWASGNPHPIFKR